MAISPIPTEENHPPTVLKVTGVMLGTSTFASPSTCLAFLDKRKKSKVVVELSRSLRVITTRKKLQQTDASVARLAKRIDKGAKLLDRKFKNWFREVRISKLDMSDYQFCILGQLFQDYVTGYHKLNCKTPDLHGFTISYSDPSTWIAQIDKLWKEEIRSRRARKGNTNRTRNRRNK